MGETTAFHLANVGFHVFAACYLESSFLKYKTHPRITPVQLDVVNEAQGTQCSRRGAGRPLTRAWAVLQVAKQVESEIERRQLGGLFGVLQCAGIGYAAPFEYMPTETFKRQVFWEGGARLCCPHLRQVDVNFFGYIYVAKAFFPFLKKSVLTPGTASMFLFVFLAIPIHPRLGTKVPVAAASALCPRARYRDPVCRLSPRIWLPSGPVRL